jgi:AsmA protein
MLLAVAVLAVLGFFLPPFLSIKQSFQARIVRSMEQAIGRKVTVGEIKLRLLPQPGFDLYNLVIADDPAFGAEPMLRADEVTATLRLSSLWRRRWELAALSLKSGVDISAPSLNLVRAPDGRWNIEALLQRASQTPSAPTAQRRAEARPRFPYIEVSGGRINFKIGQEKKVYVLTEADFSLWLASEDEWRFRLAARPVRTDFNLGDTGIVKIDGRFHRAANLRDTPVDLSVVLQNAQLGALTTLVYGRDRGWRGTLDGKATLVGTPGVLNVTSRLTVGDFRRYDINTVDPLPLETQCTAHYSTANAQLSDINCQMPLGNGLVLARGTVQIPLPAPAYNLNLAAQGVSTQALVTLARHAKENLPEDLSAQGNLNLDFNVQKALSSPIEKWSGAGRTSAVVLSSSVLAPELPLPPLEFAFEGPGSEHRRPAPSKSRHPLRTAARLQNPTLRLIVAPFRLPVGTASGANVSASFSHEGYQVRLQGEARVRRLLQIGHALGLPVSPSAAEGSARVDLQVAGNWAGFAPPQITGNAQAHEVSTPVHGLNFPLQIASAEVQLDRDQVSLRHLVLRFPGSPLQLAGSVRLPRHCTAVEHCPLQFDLQTDQMSLDEMNRLVNPKLAKRPWYDVFSSSSRSPGSVLMRMRASGHLRANELLIKSLMAQQVSTEVNLDSGVLQLKEVRATVLGGNHRGDWRADFTGTEPKFTGTGTFSGIAMLQLAGLMHDNWAGGGLSATYRVVTSGSSASQLTASLAGTASFDWQKGILRHLALDGRSGPLQFKDFSGKIDVANGVFTLAQSRMATPAGVYQVSGTASLARQLGITLRNGAHAYELSGPLDKPKVTPAAETQAALQP